MDEKGRGTKDSISDLVKGGKVCLGSLPVKRKVWLSHEKEVPRLCIQRSKALGRETELSLGGVVGEEKMNIRDGSPMRGNGAVFTALVLSRKK